MPLCSVKHLFYSTPLNRCTPRFAKKTLRMSTTSDASSMNLSASESALRVIARCLDILARNMRILIALSGDRSNSIDP